MRTTKTAIVLMALCAGLFGSCTKGSYVTPDGASVEGQQVRQADGSNVTLDFTGGKLITGAITVEDNQKIIAENRTVRIWSMFDPIIRQGLAIPVGPYSSLITRMDLVPEQANPVLHLTGMMTMTNDAGMAMRKNFDFDVMTPMQVMATSNSIALNEGTSLVTLLNLDMARLGDGIPADLWMKAMDGGDETIHVSERTTPELYQMMMKNLQMMLPPSTGTPPPPPSGGSSDTPPSTTSMGDDGPTSTM